MVHLLFILLIYFACFILFFSFSLPFFFFLFFGQENISNRRLQESYLKIACRKAICKVLTGELFKKCLNIPIKNSFQEAYLKIAPRKSI